MTIIWFPFLTQWKRSSKKITLVVSACLVLFVLKWFVGLVHHDNPSEMSCDQMRQPPNQLLASVELRGRIGNLMFQYAFLYVTAEQQGLQMVLPSSKEFDLLKDTFELHARPFEAKHWDYALLKKCFQVLEDEWDCSYDPKLAENTTSNVLYFGYFQSWKYFRSHEDELRSIFRFRPHILNQAASILHHIVKSKLNSSRESTELVGIHIRRGDYENNKHFSDFGFIVADSTYINNAMTHFRRKYKRIMFIACSNDVTWMKEVFKGMTDVFIVSGNSATIDMAILTLMNHTIMTVGTFGWWISFLTNGQTVYYKHPFRPGSSLSKEFKGSTDMHLYPNWVGMEGGDTF